MQPQILAAGHFCIELLQGLNEKLHIIRTVRFAGPVQFVFPFHGCPPHGMYRICITIIDFICENIVLILVWRPVVHVEFSAESSIISAEVIRSVQIGREALLRERVIPVHLQENAQIIILIVYGRISQLFVIIPADHITAGGGFVVISDAVVSYFGRKEIEPLPFVSELSEYIMRNPLISLKEIRTILLQIRICIQRHAVFQYGGKIFVCGDNIRQITAGQSGRKLLRLHINIPDLHSYRIRQILPHAQI